MDAYLPMPVAALYVDRLGPYPKLLGAENCWDESRDATTYPGPGPVILHPPCGPWGRLRHLCKYQRRELAEYALVQLGTHVVTSSVRGTDLLVKASSQIKRRTPELFARWLISLAHLNGCSSERP